MTVGEMNPQFDKLTSLLHWKTNSLTMTIDDLERIYCNICDKNGDTSGDETLVYDLILEQAEDCLLMDSRPNLEGKVVLSIAIRLLAEHFVINRLEDPTFVGSITANQTHALIERYKVKCSDNSENTPILDRVSLMTPESIHLNSFMYEPLVDMSDEHLRRLFSDVKAMCEGSH